MENRNSGRSTRLVDLYIQDIFTKGCCIVKDHFDHKAADECLIIKTVNRLYNEHHIQRCELELVENKIVLLTFNK